VTLLTKATTLHPELPVFAPDFEARGGAESKPAINGHAHPPSSASDMSTTIAPSATEVVPSLANRAVSKSFTGTSFVGSASAGMEHPMPAEHPRTYPRPGHGLMKNLPPEQEDAQYLDEEDRYGVFTHMYQADPLAASAGLNESAS
jgi:hypothetical protein